MSNLFLANPKGYQYQYITVIKKIYSDNANISRIIIITKNYIEDIMTHGFYSCLLQMFKSLLRCCPERYCSFM